MKNPIKQIRNRESICMSLMIWMLAATTSFAGELRVVLDQQKYFYGDEVKVTLVAENKAKKHEFRCKIFSMNKNEEWVEVIPSLIAKKPKQEEPVYVYPATSELTWVYMDKPKYFRPEVKRRYKIVIELLEGEHSTLVGSEEFFFQERGKAGDLKRSVMGGG
jgi:hypothetical protein